MPRVLAMTDRRVRGTDCRHCHRRKGHPAKRGLCAACFNVRAIRVAYPTAAQGTDTAKYARRRTEEAAELDRLVAERMQSLPPWWGRDADRMLLRERDRQVPPLVLRMLRMRRAMR